MANIKLYPPLGTPATASDYLVAVDDSTGDGFAKVSLSGDAGKFLAADGAFTVPSVRWKPVPASATATGTKGDIAADSDYAYFCIAINTWIRVAKDNTWT